MRRLAIATITLLAGAATLMGIGFSRTDSAAKRNLLTNPGFEANDLEGWTTFNNVVVANGSVRTGSKSAKILGPFYNTPNASGLFQDVPVVPGDILVGEVWAICDSSVLNKEGEPDVIQGTGNRVAVAVDWVFSDASENAGVSEILRGDDPDLPLDRFVRVAVRSGPAPTDVLGARIVIYFEQPTIEDGGVVHLDDASLKIVASNRGAPIAASAAAGLAAAGAALLLIRGWS